MNQDLRAFIAESNLIEGIIREPTIGELRAHDRLLSRDRVTVPDLEVFVTTVARARLRRRVGCDVFIKGVPQTPPKGGPWIETVLGDVLDRAVHEMGAHETHVAYELLHPFTDGNGRSGRALWAWQMARTGHDPFVRPFLHTFYYQTLNAAR